MPTASGGAIFQKWENSSMFQRPAITSIILLAALCLTVEAQQKPAAPAPPSVPGKSAKPTPIDPESNLVVLRVSGEPITEKQVIATMDTMSTQTVLRPDLQNKRYEVLFRGALDNLVILTVLKAEAKKQQVTVDQAKINQQFEVLSKQEAFKKAVAERGMSEADLKKSIEESLTVQTLLDRATQNLAPPTDADIQALYDSNPFAAPERAHLAQIFLKIEPDSTPEQKSEIKKKLEGIRADVEVKKLTFAEAADKFSQDPNGVPKGGDIGTIARSKVSIKSLEDAIFATAPGGLTPVVEGPQGFHLINVLEIKPAGKPPYEEIKPMLLQQIQLTARQTSMRKYVDDLKSKATIENFMTLEEFQKRNPAE
jgi:peptidyl-prolyl cis-trans isomerase C